ncbi:MAG TPA: ROK family transcriptional regulator [Anaerolineales bacterium]|nr:ROK family transcriptional regulator [Anaerolineales bacterium]
MVRPDQVFAQQARPNVASLSMNGAEAKIFQALRQQGEISRTDISNLTGWSKAKTSHKIREFVEKGLLVEVGEGASQGGRRPRLLQINVQLGYLVGMDIGATSLDIALADVSGKICQRRTAVADVRQPPEEYLSRSRELILEMAAAQGCIPGQILGIGIGVPGPVDFGRGVLVAPPLMPDWEHFLISAFLQPAFPNAFIVVDNDVNIMALGEQRAGDGIGIDHFIFVKIGTGIGSGIISNGSIHRGSIGSAGDIGHICVDKQGPICRCGNTGCLEAMAAGPAISEKAVYAATHGASPLLRQMMDANGGWLRPEDVNLACREGDQAALDIIRASGEMIGDVLAGLVNFFNPSHIFIGGGITSFGNHLLVAIRRAVLRRSLPLATTHLVINFSRMGPDIGVIGAIALVSEYVFMPGGQFYRS